MNANPATILKSTFVSPSEKGTEGEASLVVERVKEMVCLDLGAGGGVMRKEKRGRKRKEGGMDGDGEGAGGTEVGGIFRDGEGKDENKGKV